MKIAVISVTKSGDEIAKRLSSKLKIDLYSKNTMKDFNIKEITKDIMKEYKAIIFISSTGIAVRAISEYIEGKDKDPAVLVVDSSGKFVISLLSGHLGGANELTTNIADILHSIPVITTATDNMGLEAPDLIAKKNGLIIDNLKYAKYIAALLVDKKKVGFIDFKSQISLPKGYSSELKDIEGLVYVTHDLDDKIKIQKLKCGNSVDTNQHLIRNDENRIIKLKLIRRDIVLGIGCRKNFSSEEMKSSVCNLLNELNIDVRAVKTIATVEVKRHEQAITDLVKYLDCELRVFLLDEIKIIQDKYEGSDFVEKTIGIRAVCEPCVELSGARLITDKIKVNGMTICIGILD